MDSRTIDEKALRLIAEVVEILWRENLYLLELNPLERTRYDKLRTTLFLKKYEELPPGELKDCLPAWMPVLKDGLRAELELRKLSSLWENPEVQEMMVRFQEELWRRLDKGKLE